MSGEEDEHEGYGGVIDGDDDFTPITGGEEVPDIVIGGEEGGTPDDPGDGIDYEELARLLTEDLMDEIDPRFDNIDDQLGQIQGTLADDVLPQLDNTYENTEQLLDDLADLSNQIEEGFENTLSEDGAERYRDDIIEAIEAEGDRIIAAIDDLDYSEPEPRPEPDPDPDPDGGDDDGIITRIITYITPDGDGFDPDRRKILAGAGAAVLFADYQNWNEDDLACGEGLRLFQQPSGDIDGFGYPADQENCAQPNDPDETRDYSGGGGGTGTPGGSPTDPPTDSPTADHYFEDLNSLNAATDDRDLTYAEVEAFADSEGYTDTEEFDFRYSGGAVHVFTEDGEEIGTIAGNF